jgi:hypothetical protein
MYKKIATEDALAVANKQNESLQAQLVTANANIAYLSMVAGITLPDTTETEDSNE